MVRIRKQKVHQHRRKRSPSSKSSFNFKPILKFIIAVILLAVIGIVLGRIKYMFVDSDYFSVKGIEIKFHSEDSSLQYVSISDIYRGKILGENIFFIDLNKLKEEIELNHPELKDIVVRRVLPNKLIVQAKKRRPLMQIRSDRFYLVDEAGVILPDAKNFPQEDIPIVSGISGNIAGIRGSRFSMAEKQAIDKALLLINAISSNKRLSKDRLKMIDMRDIHNVSFFLEENNVEIKIGESEFQKRLDVLATVIEQLGLDIERVRYIDLRFDDPIVGPR